MGKEHKVGDLVYGMGGLGIIKQVSVVKIPFETYRVDWLKDGLNQRRQEWFASNDIELMKGYLEDVRSAKA